MSGNVEAIWEGPFRWPSPKEKRSDLPNSAGIYLWTVPHDDGGFIVYLAGLTDKSLLKRISQHTPYYKNGIYTLFDMNMMRKGHRQEIWHGFYWKDKPLNKQLEFTNRRAELQYAAQVQMSTYQIFVARFDTGRRFLERMEAAIMQRLYAQAKPLSDVPDKGMRLTPRRPSEMYITVENVTSVVLHGLPPRMTI